MKTQLFMLVYRLIAIFLVMLPVFINILLLDDVLISLLFVPISMTLLSIFFVLLDERILHLCHYCKAVNKALKKRKKKRPLPVGELINR